MQFFDKLDNIANQYCDNTIDYYTIKYFIEQICQEQAMTIDEILVSYANNILNNRYQEKIDFLDIYFGIFNSKKLLPIYGELLLQEWHQHHEDIVSVLQEYQTSNILLKAFELKLPYMQYNNYYSFHRKLAWAIYNIDGYQGLKEIEKIENKISPEFKREFRQMLGELKNKR